jgi:hypothetical protein
MRKKNYILWVAGLFLSLLGMEACHSGNEPLRDYGAVLNDRLTTLYLGVQSKHCTYYPEGLYVEEGKVFFSDSAHSQNQLIRVEGFPSEALAWTGSAEGGGDKQLSWTGTFYVRFNGTYFYDRKHGDYLDMTAIKKTEEVPGASSPSEYLDLRKASIPVIQNAIRGRWKAYSTRSLAWGVINYPENTFYEYRDTLVDGKPGEIVRQENDTSPWMGTYSWVFNSYWGRYYLKNEPGYFTFERLSNDSLYFTSEGYGITDSAYEVVLVRAKDSLSLK